MTVQSSEPFALFYKSHSGPVFRTLLAGTLNRAAAEDATAEAFARLRALGHRWGASEPEGVGAPGCLELLPVLLAALGGPLVGRPA